MPRDKECDGKCDKHEDTVTDVKSYKFIVKVFGTIFTILGVFLLTSVIETHNKVNETNEKLADYKLEHAKTTTDIVVRITTMAGDVSNTSEGVADIKRMLQVRQVFAETPIDTSILVISDIE